MAQARISFPTQKVKVRNLRFKDLLIMEVGTYEYDDTEKYYLSDFPDEKVAKTLLAKGLRGNKTVCRLIDTDIDIIPGYFFLDEEVTIVNRKIRNALNPTS